MRIEFLIEAASDQWQPASTHAVVEHLRNRTGRTYSPKALSRVTDAHLFALGALRVANPAAPAPSAPLARVEAVSATRSGSQGVVTYQEVDEPLEAARNLVQAAVEREARHQRSRPVAVGPYTLEAEGTREQVQLVGAALASGTPYPAAGVVFDVVHSTTGRERLALSEAQFRTLAREYALQLARINARRSTLLDAVEGATTVAELRAVLAGLGNGWG